MSEGICDRRIAAKVKGKDYKMAVRPAMMYGLVTMALTKRQEAGPEVAELKMELSGRRKRKTTEIDGCGEGGHAQGWCDRGGC